MFWELSVKETIHYLTIDLKDEKVNKLSSQVLLELKEQLLRIKDDNQINALVITSTKPGMFIAGADIAEIRDITNPKDALEKVSIGQSIFNLLDKLPCVTIAAINGVCLGGGCELALACDFRVASDHHKTQIGLPEVSLGIIPGFGGTQRMPRLIGLQQSLPLILAGKSVDPKKAAKIKLIDAYFPEIFFQKRVQEFALSLLSSKTRKSIQAKRKPKKLSNRLLETTSLGRLLVMYLAKKDLMKKTKGLYPAPLAALDAVERGLKKSLEKGLKIEADCFSRVAVTTISKNLISLFYTNEMLKKYTGVSEQSPTIKNIREAGVLGAGLMGGGIAWLLSSRNVSVHMKDISWKAVSMGYEAASKIYNTLKKKRKLHEHEVTKGLFNIQGTVSYEGFKNVDIVIEAVAENMELKKTVFSDCEKVVSEKTILATNTSALNVTDMSSHLAHPERFIGMHFFSPVNRMPLVEIIPGENTSSDTIATAVDFARKMKKTPIVVQNCPGFLVNRILIPYVNEAVLALQDGDSVERLDGELENFGMPLGPLALADEVGLDVGYKVSVALEEGYGERMKVASVFHDIYADETLRGKKSGKGFYKHTKKEKSVNFEIGHHIKRHASNNAAFSKDDTLDRCILIMVNEAARCLEEKIVENPELCDMAMIMGTGFPPFQGGLCRYADQRGIGQVVTRLTELKDNYGSRFEPAPLLVEMAEKKQTFY